MRARILVLQHEPETGLGAFAPLLESPDVDWEIVQTLDGALPTDPIDGAIVLGGSLTAGDARLHETRRWIRDGVLTGVPMLGICLGGQLLASALGGKVARAARPELGFHDVFLTDAAREDPLFAGLPARIRVFGWHEESFSLPPGALPLAGSIACASQAFRYGRAAYGLQFHPEVRTDDLVRWKNAPAYRQLAGTAGVDWDDMASALVQATPALDALAHQLLDGWMRLVGDVARRRRPLSTAA